jgi:hypothetical protein
MAPVASLKGSRWHGEMPSRNPPLRVELRREALLRNQEDLNKEHPSIQDNQGVDSRDLQSKSEGQPPKPPFTVRAEVITAQYYPSGGVPVLVHSGGDDPLVMQETMSNLSQCRVHRQAAQ